MEELTKFLGTEFELNLMDQAKLLDLFHYQKLDHEAILSELTSITQNLKETGFENEDIAQRMILFQAHLLKAKLPREQKLRIELSELIMKFWRDLLELGN